MAEQGSDHQNRQLDEKKRKQGELEDIFSAEPYKPTTSGYGQGDYYDERADWTIRGPFTGLGPRSYQRPDKSIFEDVCEKLAKHGRLDASQIQVEVINGEVTLNGTVDSRWAKRLAEGLAEDVSGVQDIHNRLFIDDPRRVRPE